MNGGLQGLVVYDSSSSDEEPDLVGESRVKEEKAPSSTKSRKRPFSSSISTDKHDSNIPPVPTEPKSKRAKSDASTSLTTDIIGNEEESEDSDESSEDDSRERRKKRKCLSSLKTIKLETSDILASHKPSYIKDDFLGYSQRKKNNNNGDSSSTTIINDDDSEQLLQKSQNLAKIAKERMEVSKSIRKLEDERINEEERWKRRNQRKEYLRRLEKDYRRRRVKKEMPQGCGKGSHTKNQYIHW